MFKRIFIIIGMGWFFILTQFCSKQPSQGKGDYILESNEVTLCFAGDVTFAYAVNKTVNLGIDPFAVVAPLIMDYDFAMYNNETAVSKDGELLEKFPNFEKFTSNDDGTITTNELRAFNFNADPDLLFWITNAGFNLATIANNHIMDYGEEALLDTRSNLTKYGIGFTGAGTNQYHASDPLIVESNGIRIAFLCFGYNNPPWLKADEDSAGTAPLDVELMTNRLMEIQEDVDFVIYVLHWGVEYDDDANSTQREMGHALIDAGADLIVAHHPHVLQGIELYEDKLIFYSLGNFLFPQWDTKKRYTFIPQMRLSKIITADGATNIKPEYYLTPILRDKDIYIPEYPGPSYTDVILEHVLTISEDLNDTELDLEINRTNEYTNYLIRFLTDESNINKLPKTVRVSS